MANSQTGEALPLSAPNHAPSGSCPATMDTILAAMFPLCDDVRLLARNASLTNRLVRDLLVRAQEVPGTGDGLRILLDQGEADDLRHLACQVRSLARIVEESSSELIDAVSLSFQDEGTV